jgi:hypothetical protein
LTGCQEEDDKEKEEASARENVVLVNPPGHVALREL